MLRQRVTFALVAVILLVLTACGAAATSSDSPSAVQPPSTAGGAEGEASRAEEPMEAAPMPPAADTGGAVTDSDESGNSGGGDDGIIDQQQNAQNTQNSQRKIIYTASLMLEVDDPRQQAQALYGLAQRYGGFVSNGNVYEYGEDEDGNPIFRADMQLRIPADQFVRAQDELRNDIANDVLSEQVDTQDVTGEYTDVESRIRNLQRLETELQLLLSEARERADNMDEVLNIYRELTNVRGEIEVLQGRINVLSDLVALATINVTLVAPEFVPTIQVVDETWDPGVTMREATRALTEDMQGFVNDVIWFGIWTLPRLLVLGVVLLVLFIIGRRIWNWARPYLAASGPTVTPPPQP